MKLNQSILLCAFALLTIVSCKKSDPIVKPPEVTFGTYILNSGNNPDNNASLTYYDVKTGAATQEFFLAKNGKKLGDTANDMIVYGGKMYIAVTISGVIFVTDMQGRILSEITLDEYKSPQCLTAYNGKVYASYYDGGIVQIDTTSFATKSAPTGMNPEEVKESNGKLYVAISNGLNFPNFDKRVAVINPTTLNEIKSIEVGLNPAQIEVDHNNGIYVMSKGNYADVPSSLQRIDGGTDKVTPITFPADYGTVLHIAMGANDKLYIIAGISNATTGWKLIGKVYVYNTATQKFEGEFVTDGTTIDNMFSLSTDTSNGDVYVGTSDYQNTGDVYVFGVDGKMKYKIASGLNPMMVEFVRGN